jgi:CRP-like cAMP-binding protein
MIDFKILKSIPVFEGLSNDEYKILSAIIEVKNIKAGEILFRSGQSRTSFFVVIKGRIEVFRVFNDEKQTLAVMDKNNFAVETALTDHSLKHEHFAKTREDCEIIEIKGEDFIKMAKANPLLANRIYSNIIKNLAERLHHSNNKIVTLYATGKIASSYYDIYNLIDLTLSTILRVIKAEKALFVFFKPLENKITIQEAIGYNDNQKIKNLVLSLSQDPVLGKIYNTKQDLFVTKEDYEKNKELHTTYSSKTMIGVKIELRKNIIGAILLGEKSKNRNFSYHNQILLNIISRQIALAVQEAELSEEKEGTEELKREYIKPI